MPVSSKVFGSKILNQDVILSEAKNLVGMIGEPVRFFVLELDKRSLVEPVLRERRFVLTLPIGVFNDPFPFQRSG